jgi:hypothetical protein
MLLKPQVLLSIKSRFSIWRSEIFTGIKGKETFITPLHNYTIEELKWDILILQWRGIGNDLKQSTPQGCGFKSSPV